ncbi:MAG: UDP-N-acetylglucosamine 1-carboxyvinyltransferase [Blastochloris viridis]|uniref:UDP-N-acetylglucosamine 1-carboxyvinyltransferase n=1 Tax=Blastochloris viridis TaxID=1079 RepID=A0A6N4R349_BLAVI|nr:MAG: UDP-N-acetylglucosamine 1-carboxyvinyltransferase [Blastochloris viridis]
MNAASHSYVITGGSPIVGEITCYGAKNFTTKAMVAACLGNSPTVLSNVPPIGDVDITIGLLKSVGATVEWRDEKTLFIDPTTITNHKVTTPDSRSNRIPILMLPVLLHRFGKAEIPRLDGCDIGKRAVDFHEAAVENFGGEIEVDREHLAATTKKKLKGTQFRLSYPSVGATETCLFLAVLARGTSVIQNAAIEPEILGLITMLRGMGAVIFLGPNREIRVEGVDVLTGTKMECLGDRIEAASWASLACATRGDITLHGIMPDTFNNFLAYYRKVGGGFELVGPQSIRFFRAGTLKPIMLETDVYPGFSTDWQQPFATLLTQAEGISVIHETVYDDRLGYTQALNRMGAKIQLSTECLGQPCRFQHKGHVHSALIMGATPLQALADPLEVPDLRGGLAYVIAAAMAEGTTTLTHIERIERGYGDISKRLENMSFDITKK